MIKIASFNANSIRTRIDIILEWLKYTSTDILCVQETKVQDKDFPEKPFNDAGYCCVFKGQKSYNGVAVITKKEPEDIKIGFDGKGEDEGPRLVCVKINNINIVNTYIPQGYAPGTEKFDYKINFFTRLHEYFNGNFNNQSPLIWLGDFNVAPEEIDVYDPEKLYGNVGFHPEEHKALEKFKKWGFIDLFRLHNKDSRDYTFFDYRVPNGIKRKMGWRIDHIWATGIIADKCMNSYIDIGPRLKEKPSDHTFIVAEISE